VREFTVPPTVTIAADASLTDALRGHATTTPDLPLYSRRVGAGTEWSDVTAAQFQREVAGVAKGLVASGIEAGQRVGLMSKTRYEWSLVDYALWTIGAVTVPIYETSSAEQVQWILSDSGAVAAVLETAEHSATVDRIRAGLPDLAQVWLIEGGAVDTLTAAGEGVSDEDLEARRGAVRADDPATIIYTSGTTGRPKGCLLSHRNLLFACATAVDQLEELFHDDAATLLFLPLAHVFARIIQCGTMYRGVRTGHTWDVKKLPEDLQAFKPTFLLSVPRVFEKVYNTAKQQAEAMGKGGPFGRAEGVAIRYSQAADSGGPGLLLRGQHALWDRLVYAKMRAALGGRCIGAISGGAPLGERLAHFFRGVGLPVLEGYGLTETSAASTVNLLTAVHLGSVGRPIPGVAVRIAEDGEVLLKGDNVFQGYWNNPEATAEVIDADGFFHTGDLGELDDSGFLWITGRKKELIVTAGGKNVAPAVLEDRLRAHWLISQALVIGDRRPYIGALITIDPESWPTWLEKAGKPADTPVGSLTGDPELVAEIQAAIDEANQAVSKAESIRKFRVLELDFTEETGELTPSLKLKRHVIMKERAGEVEAIYTK
jgi:long-chain acyl-CoA synthetase